MVEFELPVEIIQHIQSSNLMGERDAARTTLLSKSWYRAWSTRPDLVFNEFDNFPSRAYPFWEFANKTMKRYEDLNLDIRSLRLWMIDDVSLANELIVKAIKLGVVDLTIHIVKMGKRFVLPDEVLQSQTLARLYLSGPFTINLEKKEVTCYNLKSLELVDMTINGDLFRDLILRCPLIEELILDQIMVPFYDTSTSTKLDHEFVEFPKLKYLSLEINNNLPRHDLWPRFTCLKELNIVYYYPDDDLRIRIPSLERISISLPYSCVNVEFDFPNIKEFKLELGVLPRRFELKTSSSRRDQWESKIGISYLEFAPSTEWFSRLSQFVRMLSLSRSRVCLSIYTDLGNWDEFTYYPRYFGDGLAIAAVEKLKLMGNKVTPAFLDALFWCCRPKFVEIQNQCLYGLERVNVEVFQQLQSLPWETFYHDFSDKYGYDVRFQLN